MCRDHLIDPKSHNASILDVRNLTRRVGDIQIEYQKQKTINCVVRIRWRDSFHGRGALIVGCKNMWAPSSSILTMKVELHWGQSGTQYWTLLPPCGASDNQIQRNNHLIHEAGLGAVLFCVGSIKIKEWL